MQDEYVLIKASDYLDYINAYDKLESLEAFGVDNWCGYDEALTDDGCGSTYAELVASNKITVREQEKYTVEGKRI